MVEGLKRSSARSMIATGSSSELKWAKRSSCQPPLLSGGEEGAPVVAAVVVVDLVVAAPQPLVGGHGHEQGASGLGYAA